MAPTFLFDIAGLDPKHAVYDLSRIEAINPHRGDMRMLDRIVWVSEDHRKVVAAKDVKDDEFWVAGHIPGRPVFPGVMMIEAAGQLASFQYHCTEEGANTGFLGFAGLDGVKFRGSIVPGDTFMILSDMVEIRTRRVTCNTQAVVNGKLAFEGRVAGMVV